MTDQKTNMSDGYIKNLLFPVKCPFCRRIADPRRIEEAGVCEKCAGLDLFYKKADVLPHEALEKILKLYVPMRYSGEAKKAMLRYKFSGEEWLCGPFATLMHNFLSVSGGYDDIDVITWVPVGGKRFAVRGYDQSGLVARRLSESSGIPFRKLLRRNDGTGNTMTSSRNYALRQAETRFSPLDPSVKLYGSRILLVDDIFTTGSTLNECGGILLSMGALYVNAACLMSGRQDIYDAGEETA
jgi:ComF family protein